MFTIICICILISNLKRIRKAQEKAQEIGTRIGIIKNYLPLLSNEERATLKFYFENTSVKYNLNTFQNKKKIVKSLIHKNLLCGEEDISSDNNVLLKLTEFGKDVAEALQYVEVKMDND